MAQKTSKETKTGQKPAKQKDENASNFLDFFRNEVTQFIIGLIILMFTVYCGLAMISYLFSGSADQSRVEYMSQSGNIEVVENWTGARGASLSHLLINEWFGVPTFFMLFFFACAGLRLMHVKKIYLIRRFIFCALAMIWCSVTLEFFFYGLDVVPFNPGGGHGIAISKILKLNLGYSGTVILLLTALVIIMIFVSARTIPFFRKLFNIKITGNKKAAPAGTETVEADEADEETDSPADGEDDDDDEDKASGINLRNDKPVVLVEDPNKDDRPLIDLNNGFQVEAAPEEEVYQPSLEPVFIAPHHPIADNPPEPYDPENDLKELGTYDPRLDLSNYKFPGLDLLKKYESGERIVDMDEQNANKNRIVTTLEHYGIKIKSIKATVGPTITLYEIIQEDGIRISKIRNLEDDIAMSLSALGIRIIAPMPGKGTIGIEVPNKEPQIVSMQSIIASKKFQESAFDLPVAIGKTITNEIFMIDLCKMPHLLVAGATGQGKSVGLNAVITSLLYKKHPAELKFVLVDPKMVEFSIYSVIEKHFLAKLPDSDKAIITDFTKVIHTLNSLTKEMDDRYDLLMKAGVRNIKEYNGKFINRQLNPLRGHKYMPYIVVVIDEFGDLIMTAGKEIELPIARIAQKARAVGIHMVIATQRPTTNIITGTIKANFPARIAFRVTSMIDSRTILDGPGANQLIGRGDLLFSQGSDMVRVQCAFVDTPEVELISKFIKKQQGYPSAFTLPEFIGEGGESKMEDSDPLADKDPMFDECARLIVIHQQGSTSLIQRKFSIGYNRAGRIMDQLEAAGIVGAFQGSKARQVLVPDEYQLEQILNRL
ncbi:MAG: DNA translocase FtsK 4TM domain-containing protein [Dysgonamonadaceae bacterium]|nr:DNA translocase FtsK 4TM domain-containing protein [Dysgonamonadaceae bacterium]